MADRNGEAHRNAVEFVFRRMGRVRKTDEVLAALG
jgi:isochorismate hydrolase